MSKRDSENRRKVLLGLGCGVAGATQLPKSWTRPVVDSVVLPAHAETTDDTGSSGPEVTTTPAPAPTPAPLEEFYGKFSLDQQTGDNRSFGEDVLSWIVPDAHAGLASATAGIMCIKVSGASFTATVLLYRGDIETLYTGSGTVAGGASTLTKTGGCDDQDGNTVDLSVSGTSAAGAAYTLLASKGAGTSGTLPPGTECPTANCVDKR